MQRLIDQNSRASLTARLFNPTRHWHIHPAVLMSGVLVLLFALSAAAGLAVGLERNSIAALFVLGPVAVFGLLALMYRFELVVLAIPVAAFAIPFELSTGTETRLPVALLLALSLCGFWVVSAVMRKQFSVVPSPLNLPIFVFGMIGCISLVWGFVWRDPILIYHPTFIVVQIGSLLTILVSLGAALLYGNFVTTTGQLKFVVGVFIFFGSIITVFWLFDLPLPLVTTGGLWGMWTIAACFGLAVIQPNMSWPWRLALLGIMGLSVYLAIVVNVEWLSGWVPGLVALLAMLLMHSRKMFFALIPIVVLIFMQTSGYFNDVAQANIDDGSLERLILWEQNWRVVRAHWLFGTGPAGYALYYVTYYAEDARSTHNNYLDILAQFGFTGMFAWLWLSVVGIWEGWRLSQRAQPGFLRTLAIIVTGGWIGAMASMMLGDWVLPFAYNQGIAGYKYTVYSWIFLGTLISIRQILDRPPQADPILVEHNIP
ncbi:MAG: O-antigen ligase domain-containing protein [Chloroflexi bacterium AL-W]|nr:O-antigen ligase domain-containing protein [Chloroflexi bacterium AL-N1]NOK69790.1 O-antigen ligase domain-containing protein [Chloroflexi bacterium AL-N10]NOK73606.1 O-antigen ligase domain-containing protein [Chloroflexi bacterium AL-N5]NOK83960.1 O-antigen ligase domain-containing protein [Chloroflexi bacterium AL-W]NOK87937.1 O-antigen ligase domain-containing protein [Chloroflexi bacterium AL-N15]